MKHKTLLSVNSDSKTIKGINKNYLTGILYMQPDKKTCPSASKGCLKACLVSAGRGKFSNVKEARKNKKELFYTDLNFFMYSLVKDIEKLKRKALKLNMNPVVRLNGTSDIDYENVLHEGKNIFEIFPEVQFYDYTKRVERTSVFRGDFPNYHVTFSLAEDNLGQAMYVHTTFGINIAVVFKELPTAFKGIKVVNGDKDDLRFLDKEESIVGLIAKGEAKKDKSGFVY